jgi:3-oxoacyl-[acyl-carrier-protein] synthase-1/3-oxoacyl-[acyl-carrier-protein] synthase II
MRAFEDAFVDGADVEGNAAITYLGPLLFADRPCGFGPVSLILGACASGTLAVGLAREWLLAGACDVAICGGFDAVSVFVAAGFEALRAVSHDGAPRPFRLGRDGLTLGEGAALLALVRPEDAPPAESVVGYVRAFGASCDAVHLTAPDRAGEGLTRAGRAALAGREGLDVDLVSSHGTGTPFNDSAEALALSALLGERLPGVPVFALKAQTGHTLGAAGALETLAALRAIGRKVAPATPGVGAVEGGICLLSHAESRKRLSTALKLSAAFGGANAALLLTREPGAVRAPRRSAYVSRAVALDDLTGASSAALSQATGYPVEKVERADLLVHLTMASVVRLRDVLGAEALAGAGIVVGHGLATIDTNASFLARIRTAGALRGEPRRFPYTTPNACAGECAVAFGLTGPSFAVGAGPHGGVEALAVAVELVAGGITDRMVVVAVDQGGSASRRVAPDTVPGATALLVSASPQAARVEGWALELPRTSPPGGAVRLPRSVEAHRALLPLVSGRPERVEVVTPWGGFANVRFFWL